MQAGLNTCFGPFIASIFVASRDRSLSFEDFQAKLQSNELLLEHQLKTIPPDTNNFSLFALKSQHVQQQTYHQHFSRKPKYPGKPNQPSFNPSAQANPPKQFTNGPSNQTSKHTTFQNPTNRRLLMPHGHHVKSVESLTTELLIASIAWIMRTKVVTLLLSWQPW